MIGMVYRGSGARGLLDYLAGKPDAELLATNLEGHDPRAFAHQIGQVRQLHPKDTLAGPVCHMPLRPAPGEDLSDEQWREAVDLALERMGFDNAPWVAYLHDHGDGRHLHLAAYRVTFDGKLVSDSNERWRMEALARELEQQFGLTVAKRSKEARLTRPALERLLKDPDRATVLDGLRRALDEAASRRDTLRGFMTELHRLGVVAQLKIARNTGTLQGITFELPDGTHLKGSDLGKKFSLASLINRHELRIDRRPEGPILTASEVTEKEYLTLGREGLPPDHAHRCGNRRTLFWQLPPGREVEFTDLVAARLPHRYLASAEAFPSSLTPAPEALEERARVVALLAELIERPQDAPSLPLPTSAPTPPPQAPAACVAAAVRCELLSQALRSADSEPPAIGAALRAEYREAMSEALAAPPASATARSVRGEVPDQVSPSVPKVLPAELSASTPPIAPSRPLPAVPERARVLPAEFSPTDHAAEVGPVNHSDPRAHPQRAVASNLSKSSAAGPGDEWEALEAAAALYVLSPSEDHFRAWARLEGERRTADRTRADSDPPEPLRQGLAALAEDLLHAHDRHTADPSPENRREWLQCRQAYERLAKKLETLSSARAPRPEPSPAADLETLKVALLDAHDRHHAAPSLETESAWRAARAGYMRAVGDVIPAPRPDPAAPLHQDLHRLTSEHRTHCAHLKTAEQRFLANPTDSSARLHWRSSLDALRHVEAHLETARAHHLDLQARHLRQTASTLAFYETAYFRAPSTLTERLWRSAEQAHARASLGFEQARLSADARPAPAKTAAPLPPRQAQSRDAAGTLRRIFEKAILGDSLRADRMAEHAALKVWARTSVGRAFLRAASPLRSAASLIPGGRATLVAVDTAGDVLRRSLAIYAELRALNDRLAKAQAPATTPKTLERGDFSNRALAEAVIKAGITDPPSSPAATLPDAVRQSRAAQAQLLKSYRSFRRGTVPQGDLARAAARALSARAALTSRLHSALGIPPLRTFTAALGTRNGQAAAAWLGTLHRAGVSGRAIASGLVEAAPFAFASGSAALLVAGARQLVRSCANHFRSQVREILREQNEHRR
jgi:hypothetical protein